MSRAEVLTWRDAAQDPPGDDTTVMISILGHSVLVWLGWLADGVWHEVTDGAAITGTVVSWAAVPEGWFPGAAS